MLDDNCKQSNRVARWLSRRIMLIRRTNSVYLDTVINQECRNPWQHCFLIQRTIHTSAHGYLGSKVITKT